MLTSRRKFIASTAVSIPALVLCTSTRANAATTTPGKLVTSTTYTGALNNQVTKKITPSALPSQSTSWYQRVNSRVSGDSYYSLLLFSRGSNQVGIQLEKTTNGSTRVLTTQYAPARLTGSTLEMRFKTRLPELSGSVYQGGQKLASVSHIETEAPLSGQNVSSSVYLGGTQSIDFNEVTTVVPFDTSPGPLNPGAHWELAFNENFEGTSVDTSRWNIQDSSSALQYANEQEAYKHGVASIAPGKTYSLNTADCVEIVNGQAIFKLEKLADSRTVDRRERTHKGAFLDTSHPFKDSWNNRDLTKPAKFSAEFMRVEIRAKMPSGLRSGGNHACLWLRPDHEFLTKNADASEPSLEIDINEFYGHNYKGNENGFSTTERTESTVHFNQTGKYKTGGDRPDYGLRWIPNGEQKLQDEYHVWVMEMTPTDGIIIYFDNQKILHVLPNDPRLLEAKRPGVKMHLRLNFEAGTEYWGAIDEPTNDLSGRMIVDYVRAWKYIK